MAACDPLTVTRPIEDFPIGNVPLRVHHEELRSIYPNIHIAPHAWIDFDDLAALATVGKTTLVDREDHPLAWTGAAPDLACSHAGERSFLIRHPWDLLQANEAYVGALDATLIKGDVHPSATIQGQIQIGAGTRILPGVFIEGNVVIGENCKIGPNCYLRGNTSIGDGCHVGQAVEIKNSVLLDKTSVGHLSYVGDSILGEGVNFGAGTLTSNFRHDGKNHRSMVEGELVDTGRRKFGAIVGDGVHTGIHTSIYPGRKLWPGTSTRPGEIVQRDVTA
jgi:NDP-sugar pyrophosphorylase family protein